MFITSVLRMSIGYTCNTYFS